MDPIERLRALLDQYGSNSAVAVIVQTDDGYEHSIIDVRYDPHVNPTIVIEVTPT